ncbi:MAG: NAD(P)-dependent oxidoreductase [Arenicellales bacterium]
MAQIAYLNSFPAPNALEILAEHPQHNVIRVDGKAPLDECFDILRTANAYQCVGARDEVPVGLRVDETFLNRTPELLVVSASGSGVDVFDLEACTRAGVLAVNQAGANAQSVAEQALAMMISLYRFVSTADRMLRAGWSGSRWDFMGADLAGKTIGILGIGNIGTRLAQICKNGFGCRVLATDPFVTPEDIQRRGAEPVSFDTLLEQSDAISVHTPLTELTRDVFNAQAFAKMKSGAIFVNAARGSIHNENALADAMDAHHIAGAGLDVWDVEPPPPAHRLLQMPNVIATPHIAGYTRDSLENMAEHAATQLLTIFDGQRPPRPVNPAVLPVFRERYVARFKEPQWAD